MDLDECVSWYINTIKPKEYHRKGYVEGNHGYIAAKLVVDGRWTWLMKKTAWFHAFNKLFPQVEEGGWGQTFNMNIVHDASVAGGDLVVVMPPNQDESRYNTKGYIVDGHTVLAYIKNNNTIRIPSTEQREEGSVYGRMLKEIKPKTNEPYQTTLL